MRYFAESPPRYLGGYRPLWRERHAGHAVALERQPQIPTRQRVALRQLEVRLQKVKSRFEEQGRSLAVHWSGFLRNGDPAIWQLTSHTIGAGDIFTLQFLSRNNWSQGAGGSQVIGMLEATLYYDNGGTRVPVASTIATTDNATGVAEEFTFSGVAAPEDAVGLLLGVQFQNITDTGSGGGPGSSWLLVDNVRLTLVPEPSALAMLVSGLGCLLFLKRRR